MPGVILHQEDWPRSTAKPAFNTYEDRLAYRHVIHLPWDDQEMSHGVWNS
jgi:hypothetical protein